MSNEILKEFKNSEEFKRFQKRHKHTPVRRRIALIEDVYIDWANRMFGGDISWDETLEDKLGLHEEELSNCALAETVDRVYIDRSGKKGKIRKTYKTVLLTDLTPKGDLNYIPPTSQEIQFTGMVSTDNETIRHAAERIMKNSSGYAQLFTKVENNDTK